MTLARETYARLLRVPIVGRVAAVMVRGTKKVLKISGPQTVDRIDMVQTALGGIKSQLDRQADDMHELRRMVSEQRRTISQLTVMIEMYQEAERRR